MTPTTANEIEEMEASKDELEPESTPEQGFPQCINGGLSLIPLPGHEMLAQQVKERIEAKSKDCPTKVDIAIPEFGCRSSGEPFIRLGKRHVGGHDCIVLTSGPGTYKMQGHLTHVLNYLSGRRARRISVITGYFPLGRSDKDEGREEFALPPLMIKLMMAASNNKIDRIVAVDLHAPQVVMSGHTGLITEVSLTRKVLQIALQRAMAKTDKICLSFPDDSAAKRVETAVESLEIKLGLNLPSVYGSKRRSSSRGSKLKRLYGATNEIEGSIVISVDDEIATGGTNINAAKKLKNTYKAKGVWAVVTHGVLCGNAIRDLSSRRSPIDHIFISETIPTANRPRVLKMIEKGLLTAVPWVKDLSWIVYHHHWDESIRRVQ